MAETKEAKCCSFLLTNVRDTEELPKSCVISRAVIRSLMKTVVPGDVVSRLVVDAFGANADSFQLTIPDIDVKFARMCFAQLSGLAMNAREFARELGVASFHETCETISNREDRAVFESGFAALHLLCFDEGLRFDASFMLLWVYLVLAHKAEKLFLLKLSAAIDLFVETKAHITCRQPTLGGVDISGQILGRAPFGFNWYFNFHDNSPGAVKLPMRQRFFGAQGSHNCASCTSESLLAQAKEVARECIAFVHVFLPNELVLIVGDFFYDDEFQWTTKLPAVKTRSDLEGLDVILAICASFSWK